MLIKSNMTGEFYEKDDALRIVNVRQVAFYWGVKGIRPYDIYPSKDFKTNEAIMVFLFSKEKTKDAYNEWLGMREVNG